MANFTTGQLQSLAAFHELETELLKKSDNSPLPASTDISAAAQSLHCALPDIGIGTQQATIHLLNDVAKGLNGSSLSAHYYGLVTGGITPAARIADHLTTLYDQNACLHIPDQSIASLIESRGLEMLLQLFNLDQKVWEARTLTTGATASNILGLACGRQWVIEQRLKKTTNKEHAKSAAELGMLKACRLAEIDDWQVLTTIPHSSLLKAASVVGIGSGAVINVGIQVGNRPMEFDLVRLESALASKDVGSIVAVSCGEVNTGWFDTYSVDDMRRIRDLCDQYGAWLHIDGAFGMFARLLDGEGEQYARVTAGTAGIDLADSVTGDGHKMLNVPYDCGFFFSKHLDLQQGLFQNPNAAYLRGATGSIPSPLNMGLENSRRQRGLPVYATLLAYGRRGYTHMVREQVDLARAVAKWIANHDSFELLQQAGGENWEQNIFMILLFRARNVAMNETLVESINRGRSVYVSGTTWKGQKAARIAIANWQVDAKRDFPIITEALEAVLQRA